MAPNVEPLELRLVPTTISLNGQEDLLIESFGTNQDMLQIHVDGANSQLVISDPGQILNTNISGANGSGTNVVQIPFSSFPNAKQLIVNTFDGDDVIRLTSDGTSFRISPVMDGGGGFDVIESNAVVSVVTANVDVTWTTEDIRLGADITTAGGKVSLFGNVTITNDVSITTDGTTDGDVLITGQVESGAGPSNYTLISTPRTYQEAGMQAWLDVPGGHLVTIRSASEQITVQGIAGNNDVWIGATDGQVEGDWIWEAGPDFGIHFWNGDGTTGRPVNGEYSNWLSGEPDNLDGASEADAAFLVGSDPAGLWRDGDINVARPYVVESPTLFALTINAATGMVNFSGSVGNFLPLKSFAVTAGQTQLFGGTIRTAGPQTFNSALLLSGPALLRAEEVNFNGGVGSVTGMSGLTLAPIKVDAPINVGAVSDTGPASFDVTDTDLAAIAAGFATLLIGEPPPFVAGRQSQTGEFSVQSVGPVTITSSTFLNPVVIAGGSISVTELDAGTNQVDLVAANGSITDGGDAGADIRAGNLSLDSATGVGSSSNVLETTVSAVAARGAMSGGVFIANTGDLSIGPPSSQGGIFTNNDVASVTSTGSITVLQPIFTNGGDVRLAAANGIAIKGVPIVTAGGQFTADADSNNDGSGTFSISSLTDFVDWTSTSRGTFADGTAVDIFTTTMASATAQFNANDARFSDGNIYSPAQASGDFVETRFSQPSEAVTFSFSNPQFGLFLHFDGMQYQGTPFDPAIDNPVNLYAFDHTPMKVSGESTWDVDTQSNSIRQISGDHLADQDGTVRFDDGLNSLTMFRKALGVASGADSVVKVQLGLFRAGVVMTSVGAITIRAADVDLNGVLNADSGLVSLIPSGSNRTVDLGAAGGSGQFILTDAELDQISTTGEIVIGDTSTGDLTINDAVTRSAATNLSLRVANGKNIAFSGSNASLDANSGNVALTTGGTGAIVSGQATKDVRAANVTLIAGSGGIGASDNALTTDASNLTAATDSNADAFLSEIDSITIDSTGLSAGSGTITFASGKFRLGGANRIDDDSKLSVSSGATFQLNGFNETLASLKGSGSVVNGTAAAATLTVNLPGNDIFSGVLGGAGTNENNLGLTKSGAGTLTLSEANTYTGATNINAGTLLINGSVTTDMTVASGATVGGTGTINSGNTLTVQSGGTVAPGTSPGILNSGNVTLQSGSTFSVELNGTTVGTQYDQLNVTGTVTIGSNVTLNASLGFTPSAGDTFVIIKNDGSDVISGTFNGLPQGTLLTLNSVKFHIVYNHNSGDGNPNDIALIVNRAPVVDNQSFSISESSSNGAAAGTVLATDADSAVTFAITGGNTGNVFAISSTSGQITVNDANGLDFESNPTFNLTVEVTDDSGVTDTATIAINVTNAAPSAPVDGDAAANSVSEGAVNGDTVGIDADSTDTHGGTVTFRLADDVGGRFRINSTTGVVTVADASLLNFESATSHTITVEASDDTNVSSQDFTINVTNVAPSTPVDTDATADSVSEGAINDDLVGIDADSGDVHGGAITFSLTNDAGGRFAIHPTTGIVRVANASLLNFESATSHLITVQASDGTSSTTKDFTIAVTNVAPAAPIDGDGSPNAVSEGIANGDPVGIDANSGDVHGGTVTFSLTDNAGGRFAIDSTTGVVTVAEAALFDFSVAATLTIVVQASDGTDSSSRSFTIDVRSGAPDAPQDVDDHANTVPEGALEGSRVGITLFATDPQRQDVFYRLTDDVGGRFAIDPLTGVVTVKNGRLLQFSAATRHTLRAVAVDAQGNASEEVSFDVTVTQVPEDAMPLASILPTRVSVVEGDSGPNFITFLVKLNKPSLETITIDFTTRVGDDRTFQRPEGIDDTTPFATDEPGPWDFFRSTGQLTFDPGVTEQPLRVQIRPDDVPEANEFFFVQLRTPVNATLAPQQSVATARILDDDSVPQLIVSNTQMLEGDSAGQNEQVFTVQLIGDLPPGTTSATTDFVTGNIAIDTAIAGSDYTTTSGTLTFTNADRVREVRVPILGDFDDEADETVSVRFENPINLGLSSSEVVGTIINDDSPNVVVSITPSVFKAREGNSGSQQVEFLVTLVGKPTDTVSVNYTTTDGTATAGSDYTASSGMLNFTLADIASGNVQKSLFVTIFGDTGIEPDEALTLTLSLPTASLPEVSLDPDRSTGRLVLRNDDQAILTEDGDALALALSNDLTAILGTGPKNNPALIAALRARALQIIQTQGLTKAIVIIIDPVDFVLTDPDGRQAGYTEGTGVVNQIPGTYYSGDGSVELLIVPLPPDGTYNVQLAGLGGDFNASITVLDNNGTSTNIVSQALADGATSSISFQVGGNTTIPVGLGLAAANAAAPTVGVVGAFGQSEFRLVLALAFEEAASNGLEFEGPDSQPTGLMFWLTVSARVVRQRFLEPLWQSLETPFGDWLGEGQLTPRSIPPEIVDQFWSQLGQTLTGVPSGIYRLGDMLESLIPTLRSYRNRPSPPRAREQGQSNPAPNNNGVKARRSTLERPRATPQTPAGGSGQAQPPNKPNATKDTSVQTPETKKPDDQQSSVPRTRCLWFTFKDEASAVKPSVQTKLTNHS